MVLTSQPRTAKRLKAIYARVVRRPIDGLLDCLMRLTGVRFVHMLHIGKTGGTAVKHALKPYRRTPGQVLKLHPHGIRLRDVPEGEGVFFFVRNPITRFVSGFYSRQRQGQPRHYSPSSPAESLAFAQFESPKSLAEALSSQDRTERLSAQHAMRSIEHVRDSYWDWFENEDYLLSRLPDIIHVGFQETLTADFEVLKSEPGLPPNVSLPTDAVLAHRNPKHLSYNLNATATENLRWWYRREWEFLNIVQKLTGR